MEPIHTLNARSNILLEVARDTFKIKPERMRAEILAFHKETISLLSGKGIDYSRLRPALVPSTDRHEAGYLFDVELLNASVYGEKAARWLLPLLDPRSTQSLRCGDLIARDPALIEQIVRKHLTPARRIANRAPTIYFCIYLNNLSEAMLTSIHAGLKKHVAYIGYLPATYSSAAKTFLSTTLVSCGLKYGRKIIMSHEDDRPNSENVNLGGFPFAEHGYEELSLQSMYHDVFLSYKIERAFYRGFEVDTEMSLNAISDQILPIDDFNVEIEQAKHEYLKSHKAGKLKMAGLCGITTAKLKGIIRSKIAANYIYSLQYLDEHDVAKFCLMLELPATKGLSPARLNAALHYLPERKQLRLITLY